jgi:DNA replication protein DnaC
MNNNNETLVKMKKLRLHGMATAFENLLSTSSRMDLTIDEAVTHLVDSEWDDKHKRRLDRLIKGAKFRYKASIDELNYDPERKLDKNLMLRLSSCNWVENGEDILVTGATGVGKSYIGSALGYQACNYGFTVGYYSSSRLFAELTLGKKDSTYIRTIQRIMRKQVLIFDDFGLEKLNQTSRMALLEIIEERHKIKPTIIITQLPISLWHETIGEPTIADAIMDRLVYNSPGYSHSFISSRYGRSDIL